MQIKSTLINGSGQVLDVFYRDINSSSDILGKKIMEYACIAFVMKS